MMDGDLEYTTIERAIRLATGKRRRALWKLVFIVLSVWAFPLMIASILYARRIAALVLAGVFALALFAAALLSKRETDSPACYAIPLRRADALARFFEARGEAVGTAVFSVFKTGRTQAGVTVIRAADPADYKRQRKSIHRQLAVKDKWGQSVPVINNQLRLDLIVTDAAREFDVSKNSDQLLMRALPLIKGVIDAQKNELLLPSVGARLNAGEYRTYCDALRLIREAVEKTQ